MAVSRISGANLSKGQELLHRQCWNWGRDIERRDGNLLLEAGFLQRRPPEGEAGSSCYTLALPGSDSLMLWGFGLLYGMPRKGCVFLNRYQFAPVGYRWRRPGADLEAHHDPDCTDATVAARTG